MPRSPGDMPEGSSPLTRGARRWHRGPALSSGLIPAHAGSTVSMTQIRGSTRAHPRSRGEHAAAVVLWCWGFGSSPLTRGARSLSTVARPSPRLIPAHAGSTLRNQQQQQCTAYSRSNSVEKLTPQRRCFLKRALAHSLRLPFPKRSRFPADAGRIIKDKPSKSVGTQSCR